MADNSKEIIKKTKKKSLSLPNETAKKELPKMNRKNLITILLTGITIILAIVSIVLIKNGINIGASSLKDSFTETFSSEKEAAYNKLYKLAYERAEEKHHVSNEVLISIGNLEETQKLEVLKANDIEFITEDRDNNSGNVTAWLEVNGEGTFIVDLQAAEFIIDNNHHYVLVRIPNPELTNINIKNTTRKLFSDDIKNGSYSEGVDLALKQHNEAKLRIQKSLLSNQYIYDNAKEVAKNTIQNLVKQLNPDIIDLTVDVEYIE